MPMTRGFLLLFLLTILLLLLATEADARRRRRLKRQHNDDDVDDSTHRRARRRDHHTRRRRGRGSGGLRRLNSTITTPIRHHDPSSEGIPVGVAAEPPVCPPPVTPFAPELCSAPACLHHHQCSSPARCCFNGCVHTCLAPLENPAVIDWLEDTGSILPILEESAPPELPIRYEDTGLDFAEGAGETVHLPGGCTISGTQYTQLQDFMKTPSIEDCKCSQGEVVCAVKMFNS